jgi:hypothetical protein
MSLLFSHTHFILVCEARKYALEFSFFPLLWFQKIIKQYHQWHNVCFGQIGGFHPQSTDFTHNSNITKVWSLCTKGVFTLGVRDLSVESPNIIMLAI